jgi:N-acetylglutamate synthase/N-acetylornithine aminotransferase
VLAATGSVPLSAPLDPTRVSVSFVPTDGSPVLPLLVNGEPEQVDEVRAKEILSAEDLEVRVDLQLGSVSAKYWTCDFSYVSPTTSNTVMYAFVDGYDIYRSTLGSMETTGAKKAKRK